MKLFEIVSLKHNTEIFLAMWTEGSSRAILHLSPMVRSDLKKTVTESSYKVYRGWKFADEDLVADVFGSSHQDLKPGSSITIKLETPHSWTKSKSEAEKFASPRFDSLEKSWFDDEAIEDLGYENGDLLGIGVLVEATIPSTDVIADLANVEANLLSYEDEEQEIISAPGSFHVKVIAVDVHHFKKTPKEDDTEDMTEKEWERHNRESEEERAHMEKMREDLPKLLKKKKLKVNEEDLKKLLDEEKSQDVAIAVIFRYGHKFPEVKKYAVEHAGSYKKCYNHFNVKGVAQVHDSIMAMRNMDHSKWEAED